MGTLQENKGFIQLPDPAPQTRDYPQARINNPTIQDPAKDLEDGRENG